MSRPGLEPGPPAWEASTLEKSHLDSLSLAGTPTHDESATSIQTLQEHTKYRNPTTTTRICTCLHGRKRQYYRHAVQDEAK